MQFTVRLCKHPINDGKDGHGDGIKAAEFGDGRHKFDPDSFVDFTFGTEPDESTECNF